MLSASSKPCGKLHYLTPALPRPPHRPIRIGNQKGTPTRLVFLLRMAPMATDFEDFLPLMADKLGGEGLMSELCNGFNLLMDREKGVITFESLKRNSALLGLSGFTDEELLGMLREGDVDGDGALNQMEFCILMFRLSPDLMAEARRWVDEALEQELEEFMSE